jgi:hypothetical protein
MNPVSDGGDHCSAGHNCPPLFVPNVTAVPGKATALGIEDLLAPPVWLSGLGIWVNWYQPYDYPFDSPEFYALGCVAAVHYDNTLIGIANKGEREWQYKGTGPFSGLDVKKPEEFRYWFPSGQLPDNGQKKWRVVNRGWFALDLPPSVDLMASKSFPSIMGEADFIKFVDQSKLQAFYSLTEAVAYAKAMFAAHAKLPSTKAPVPG